ncbi:MAG: hypothetical protein GF330_09830 [Candidatus Eisenbacteria bacterium]|nr:hypothetical protein [Candidatus Eisenbacteria bacterium]
MGQNRIDLGGAEAGRDVEPALEGMPQQRPVAREQRRERDTQAAARIGEDEAPPERLEGAGLERQRAGARQEAYGLMRRERLGLRLAGGERRRELLLGAGWEQTPAQEPLEQPGIAGWDAIPHGAGPSSWLLILGVAQGTTLQKDALLPLKPDEAGEPAFRRRPTQVYHIPDRDPRPGSVYPTPGPGLDPGGRSARLPPVGERIGAAGAPFLWRGFRDAVHRVAIPRERIRHGPGGAQMTLVELLKPSCIQLDSPPLAKEELIRGMVEQLAAAGLVASVSHVTRALLERERVMSTGVGRGVALPHARSAAVREFCVALARPREPVDFAALDAEPVRLVLMAVGPGDRTGLMRILTRISRLLYAGDLQKRLLQAKSPDEVLRQIGSEEAKLKS